MWSYLCALFTNWNRKFNTGGPHSTHRGLFWSSLSCCSQVACQLDLYQNSSRESNTHVREWNQGTNWPFKLVNYIQNTKVLTFWNLFSISLSKQVVKFVLDGGTIFSVEYEYQLYLNLFFIWTFVLCCHVLIDSVA